MRPATSSTTITQALAVNKGFGLDPAKVNPNGGAIAMGHPLGATGACGIAEIVWQLRGESGGRQQKGAKAGAAHVIGLTSACTLNVLQA